MYGSAIWNHWLDRRYGAERRAPRVGRSRRRRRRSRGFAPGAYDRGDPGRAAALGFAYELRDFMAATAEWEAANSGIREGATFPDGRSSAGTLASPTARRRPARSTTPPFALFDVPVHGDRPRRCT